MHVFHYHLVTSQLREVEGRYLGKLGFDLVARYGRVGDDHVAVEPGVSWERLDHDGFTLDEDDFQSVLGRAMQWNLRVQEHGGRRTFVATNAGYRLEVHPPRDWIEELLQESDELRIVELQLRADEPATKAGALADILGLEMIDNSVLVGT